MTNPNLTYSNHLQTGNSWPGLTATESKAMQIGIRIRPIPEPNYPCNERSVGTADSASADDRFLRCSTSTAIRLLAVEGLFHLGCVYGPLEYT